MSSGILTRSAWTDAHRVEILRAFYTILLGNPTLKKKRNAAMRTRFKMWWRLVGSAVEHAAAKAARDRRKQRARRWSRGGGGRFSRHCSFAQDEEDEDDNALVEALTELAEWAADAEERMARTATSSRPPI